MESFSGKMAVVTGGGSGMGRELVVQLSAKGCSVATCDVNARALDGIRQQAEKVKAAGVAVTVHTCDVSDEVQVQAFHREVVTAHGEVINLLFNNAGIGGGSSFVAGSREEWERTFAVDWWGVYYCTRAFLPNLVAAPEACLVNTSSVNGFWASLGPGIPHTAYSTAKFAVKGFSEALIEDLRVNAPHVKVAVVMPGHIGTDIVANSRRYFGRPEPDDMTQADLAAVRDELAKRGLLVAEMADDQLRETVKASEEGFRTNAPLDAAGAAAAILDALHEERWRILVGEDAKRLDQHVRADPERAYDYTGSELGSLRLAGPSRVR
jgi:NAD(P)-dependent dehydrogenase (short-subunit alcohol dehydrogenase family)